MCAMGAVVSSGHFVVNVIGDDQSLEYIQIKTILVFALKRSNNNL